MYAVSAFLVVRVELEAQHQVEELHRIVQRQEAPVVQVGRYF